MRWVGFGRVDLGVVWLGVGVDESEGCARNDFTMGPPSEAISVSCANALNSMSIHIWGQPGWGDPLVIFSPGIPATEK